MAIEIVSAAVHVSCPLALQAIGEFYMAATRKVKLRPTDVQPRVSEFLRTFETFSCSRSAILLGSREAAAGRFQFWDAVLLASAAEFGCTVCFSGDMSDGARLDDIVVRNPFGESGLTEAARQALGLTP
ncbi:MAG: hypothetical protein ACREHE_16990 [Rhizomicrobium sp.]